MARGSQSGRQLSFSHHIHPLKGLDDSARGSRGSVGDARPQMTASSRRRSGRNTLSNTPAFRIHITTATHMLGGIRGVCAMNVCFVCVVLNQTKGRHTHADRKARIQTHRGYTHHDAPYLQYSTVRVPNSLPPYIG